MINDFASQHIVNDSYREVIVEQHLFDLHTQQLSNNLRTLSLSVSLGGSIAPITLSCHHNIGLY